MRRILKILLLFGLINMPSALAQTGTAVQPAKLGFRAVDLASAEKAKLYLSKIIRSLEANDPFALAGLMAPDYQEVPAQESDATGFLMSKKQEKRVLSAVLNGREAFLEKVASSSQVGSDPLRYSHRDLQMQAGEFTCTIEARTLTDEHRASVRLHFIETPDGWRLAKSDGLSLLIAQGTRPAAKSAAGQHLLYAAADEAEFDDSKSFRKTAIAPEYNIEVLNQEIAQQRLNRKLLGMPSGAALFAYAEAFDTAPFFKASYVQIVSDPAWNRLMYGDYEKWLKSYNAAETGLALNRPYGVVVDVRGVVFVADAGNARVVVLKLTGPADDLALLYLGALGESVLSQPTDLAWDDRGTLNDTSDDLLWVLDRGKNAVFAFSTNLASKKLITRYDDAELKVLSAIAIGRFDGKSDAHLYVADTGTRTIHRLFFDGEALHKAASWQAAQEMVASSLSTDHWGQLYLADQAKNEIVKFSPDLEVLTQYRGQQRDLRPVRLQTIFGAIRKPGQAEPVWSGFDQTFLLEAWTQKTGARRLALGTHFKLEAITLSADLERLTFAGMLTDPAKISVSLARENSGERYDVLSDWQQAGTVALDWHRRSQRHEQLASGYYTARVEMTSTYGVHDRFDLPQPVYLPFFYYEDCGALDAHSPYLVRGESDISAGATPAHSTIIDPQEIRYRFRDLNPSLDYEVMVSYLAAGAPVEQALFANEKSLHAPMLIGQTTLRTAWLSIPSEAVERGELDLKIAKTAGQGPATVSELWLREANFDPHDLPAIEIEAVGVPSDFVMKQNYPNPFNPATTIEFSIPEHYRGVVTLRIYNMLGQLVRELENAEIEPGVYRKIWDGRDAQGRQLASGIYLYRLQAGAFTASRKLVMMK